MELEEELIDLQTNKELNLKFKNGYHSFWLQKQISDLYPGLWRMQYCFTAVMSNRITDNIEKRLIETGERERLTELLRSLLRSSNWAEKVREECLKIIQRDGIDGITVETVVTEILPTARRLVPESIKRQLLEQLQQFCEEETE
ncbi:Transcription and mRNA export factor ENY2 [Trichinella britovi]|uniref:Transcription and mRNA export factor ENY2 n=6 Tax=Trichinella TaxID=6333 RepID=A0A0V1CJY4_TRIBR|nr:Transcription and mRNA export factor ENY2 [Trichinella britovi]